MKTNDSKKSLQQELTEYIEILKTDPIEREKMNKALQREQKKLAKKPETQYAAMFLSAIKF